MSVRAQLDESDGTQALHSLAEYQPGGVVSRTIVKRSAGTVTAFAFDAGEGLSEHTAQFDALVVGVDGAAVFTIESTPHTVAAGDVLLLPAGKPHGLKTEGRFKMLLVMIKA